MNTQCFSIVAENPCLSSPCGGQGSCRSNSTGFVACECSSGKIVQPGGSCSSESSSSHSQRGQEPEGETTSLYNVTSCLSTS